jgi:Na+/H+ antiporter NhaC
MSVISRAGNTCDIGKQVTNPQSILTLAGQAECTRNPAHQQSYHYTMIKTPASRLLPVLTVLVLAWILHELMYAGPAGASAGIAEMSESGETPSIAGRWTSLLPPLVAIGIALWLKQVFLALFIGIWAGAWLAAGAGFGGILTGFFDTIGKFIVPAAADADRMSIMLFTLLIGGVVGIISANGGIKGVINLMSKVVKTRIQGQFMTAMMGFLVFFDDYANTMIVGNTMRPLTDKLRITRAKLAYLVDSTAAPVATIALVSTWIGAMVAYIASSEAGMADFNEAAYLVFINSLPYNFYAFFAIIFVLMIALTGRDFGPMLTARMNLLKAKDDPEFDHYNVYHNISESTDSADEKTSHWLNAVLPVAVLVVSTIVGLFITGEGDSIQDIIGSADSYQALTWAGLLALATAIVITIGQRLLDNENTLKGMMKGMHIMFDGLIILVLAWALSDITRVLGTAEYLVSVFDGLLNPYWVPVLIFVISAGTAFATGSSWGTMGILMPIAVPLVWNLSTSSGVPADVSYQLIYASVSSVLAGAVWGDHCSPISDTTILSSIASQCDHIEHVRTQLPYALVVGAVSVTAIIGSTVLGITPWIIYPAGIAVLFGILFKFGRFASFDNPEDSASDLAG